jgi:hypothetical protein
MKNTCSNPNRKRNDNSSMAPDALASQPWITQNDLTGDIERTIVVNVNTVLYHCRRRTSYS